MRVFLVGFVLVCAATGVLSAEQYSTKYDNVNLDEILSNQRLYQKYFDCIIGVGKCTPDGAVLKDTIPDALQTSCAKCNAKQKKGVERILRYMMTEKKSDYDTLENKIDPDGIYRKKYNENKKKLLEGKPFFE